MVATLRRLSSKAVVMRKLSIHFESTTLLTLTLVRAMSKTLRSIDGLEDAMLLLPLILQPDVWQSLQSRPSLQKIRSSDHFANNVNTSPRPRERTYPPSIKGFQALKKIWLTTMEMEYQSACRPSRPYRPYLGLRC